MTIWQQLLVVAVGNVVLFLLQMWYFRWKKREEIPSELFKEIRQLSKDVVDLRGQVKYLQGRINGKHWREA